MADLGDDPAFDELDYGENDAEESTAVDAKKSSKGMMKTKGLMYSGAPRRRQVFLLGKTDIT